MPVNPIDVQSAFLRDAIIRISIPADSGTRSLIESYLPCASRAMAHFGEVRFPATLMPHPANPERYLKETTRKYEVLCFHVGNAIRALYESVAVEKLDPKLVSRVKKLLDIADKGLASFEIRGTVQDGFYLGEVNVSQPTPPEAPKQADAGRGASTGDIGTVQR